MIFGLSTLLATGTAPVVTAFYQSTAANCRRIDQIYTSGKDLCEKMWGSAFVYEANESHAYTMWFFDAANPNDATSARWGHNRSESCNLHHHHKDVPSPEPTVSECHPWRNNACSRQATVGSLDVLKSSFGESFHWDRCGPLSQECERFFVQEACFYECDANVGFYRKYDADHYDPRCDAQSGNYSPMYAASRLCSHNTWELHQMPIKASYCDAWYAACRADHFCAGRNGDFFSCAGVAKNMDEVRLINETWGALSRGITSTGEYAHDTLQQLWHTAVLITGSVAVLTCCFGIFLIRRECEGRPVFNPSHHRRASPSLMGAQQYSELTEIS